MQRVHRLLTEVREPRRMPHRSALRGESVILAGLGVGLAELVEPPAEVFLLTLPARPQLFEIAQRIRRREIGGVSHRRAGP